MKKIREKSLTMPKKLKVEPFSLSWYGMLREKQEKLFLVQCSLGQMIEHGTKKIRRTFKNYFGQFV